MKRAFVLAAALVLSACASGAEQSEEAGAWISHSLSCNAAEAHVCEGEGCTPARDDEIWAAPISVVVPALNQSGRFCIATGCEDAEVVPAAATRQAFHARVRTNDRTQMDAALEIARDLRSFRLSWPEDGAVRAWAGACEAAGS